jgi:hypothetical protein
MLYFSRRDRTADRSSSMWRVVDVVDVACAKRAEEVEKAEGPFAEGSFVSATIRASRDFFFAIAFGPTPTPTAPPRDAAQLQAYGHALGADASLPELAFGRGGFVFCGLVARGVPASRRRDSRRRRAAVRHRTVSASPRRHRGRDGPRRHGRHGPRGRCGFERASRLKRERASSRVVTPRARAGALADASSRPMN